MFRSFVAGLTLVLTVACLPALAQRAGGGFGGGFGGRGPGGGGGVAMLLGNEAVQKELGLSEDQIAKLQTLREEMGEKMRESFSGFAGLRDLPEAERTAKMEELREKMAENQKKMAAELQPKLSEILSTEQTERLQQIQWQVAGPTALNDEALIKALNLSEEQQAKLKSIAEEAREKISELGGGRGPGGAGNGEGFEERMTKVREITEQSQKAAMEVLTTEQQEQLAKLKGKEFDVAQLRGGFGGGRGGFGGGAGGRPGARPEGGNRPARPE